MRKKLNEYLIPCESNEYAPHALQKVSVAVMFALMLVTFSLANIQAILWQSSDWLVSSVFPAVIVDLTNQERSDDSLHTLTRSAVLDEAARMKAEDMATHQYFDHYSPEGVSPWNWFDKAGYNYVYAGENLAVHFTDSEDVVKAWMDSPGHRANILSNHYTEIGVGTAKGEYEGFPTIFVVQLFGTPALASTGGTVASETNIENTKSTQSDVVEGEVQKESDTSVLVASAQSDHTVTSEINTDVTPAAQENESVQAPSVSGTQPESIVIYSDLATTARNGTPAEPHSGAEGSTVDQKTNIFLQTAVHPGLWLQILYALFALGVIIALVLSIVIEWRRQHPIQIAYGSGLLVAMALLLYVHTLISSGVTIV